MSKGVEIVCELHGVKVTAKQAKTISDAIRKAFELAYPNENIRGLWVHQGIKPLSE